ncbi:hypothetical protein [Limnohabitans sp.]|uniref:hypothetical protein n=1 Tax=Limnohabitans sp. TaxID=1907725 RepID=UPI00286EE335|nr:hypothetical protein [Limnohabitans sp.]
MTAAMPQRLQICAEARSWLGTPYHHMARIKGVGVDCLQILIAVYSAVGLMDAFDTGYYPNDWMLHRDEERYLAGVLEHAHPVDTPSVGDMALYRFGRTYSHSAILVDGGLSVHSYMGLGVVLTDPCAPPLVGRSVQHFSFFK